MSSFMVVCSFSTIDFDQIARPNVRTPNRPINIKRIIVILPTALKSPVIPMLIPTVPRAEATSKIIFSKSKSSENVRIKIPKKISEV